MYMPNNAVHKYTQQQHDMHAHIQVHHNTQSSHAHINTYKYMHIDIYIYERTWQLCIHALIHIHMQHSAII